MHLVRPELYRPAMPDWLPAHEALILLSGLAEILGGASLLVPSTRPLARGGLIALLVAVFPANLHMALHPERFPDLPPAALWIRLPLQGLLIAWVARVGRPDPGDPPGA